MSILIEGIDSNVVESMVEKYISVHEKFRIGLHLYSKTRILNTKLCSHQADLIRSGTVSLDRSCLGRYTKDYGFRGAEVDVGRFAVVTKCNSKDYLRTWNDE
jgi:hypothetical protein